MKTIIRPLATVAAAAAVVSLSAPLGATSNTIAITINNLESNKGEVRCALHTSSNWLKKPVIGVESKPKGRRATCRFEGVKPGVYAIAAFHDEDSDDKLDTNFVGLPKEGYTASRDARAGTFGPPKFKDARFTFKGGVLTLRATMDY